ncbi:MAG TPA: copper oxidase [Terriglobales bacterium]|nr:copper oxidase [Terriglobales bacterium]
MNNRRTFLQRAVALGGGLLAAPKLFGMQHQHGTAAQTDRTEPGRAGAARSNLRVQTPDIPDLPFRLDNGVKEFHLTAEVVERELLPGRKMKVWGYNGSCPGPTIQVNQGDRVRIILDNHLPEPTTMHWHGFEIPIAMDGMPYISQKPIASGGRFIYEFTLHQEGTYFYHSHGAMQEMLGMIGMFIMHPQKAYQPKVDHDFGIILQGWALLPNSDVPNTAGMEFNWLTFNGKAGPATTPMLARLGSRVRIRIVNLGMDHHPIHLHGHTFAVTGSEGGRQPQALWGPANTVLVGVAQARDIEFNANNPGDWMIHCHLPHHMMNSMMDLMGERMITTSALTSRESTEQMQIMSATGVQMGAHSGHGASTPGAAKVDPNAVPGFPQDAFMEMPMDEAVDKPENYGLAQNWSAGMMGMMSLVRVLPPDKYDHIMDLIANRKPQKKNQTPEEHKHPS